MDDRDGHRSRPRQTEVAGLSPVRAFMVVCALATVVGGLIFATRDASPSEPPPSGARRSPDYSLTDAEALARFGELHDLFRAASIKRDASLLSAMLTTDSPLQDVARRQIRQLIDDQVRDKSRFDEQRVQIVENSPSRVVIEQVVVIRPKFVAATTDEVVSTGPVLRQHVRWVLEPEQTVWKVYDSEVVRSRRTH